MQVQMQPGIYLSLKLVDVSAVHILSMILEEVVELVIHTYILINIFVKFKRQLVKEMKNRNRVGRCIIVDVKVERRIGKSFDSN